MAQPVSHGSWLNSALSRTGLQVCWRQLSRGGEFAAQVGSFPSKAEVWLWWLGEPAQISWKIALKPHVWKSEGFLPFWTIFPRGRLPGLHPCLSVVTRNGDSASAGIARNALVWFRWCTSTLNYLGVRNGAAKTTGSGPRAQICLLENDRSFSPSFLSEAREHVSECRCLTFLMLPHRSKPFICVITISCTGLSLWLLNSLLCMIHPHVSFSH